MLGKVTILFLLLACLSSGARLTNKRGHLRARAVREDPPAEEEEYESMYGDDEPMDDVEGESFDDVDYKPFENPDIIKKYDGLEAVAEVLFTIACKAKHKLDVAGAATEKTKDEGWKQPQMMDYIKKIQKAQVGDLKQTCGKLTAKSSEKCLKSCTTRWASAGAQSLPKQKEGCINMCNIKHRNWEEECLGQVENLKQVYIVEQDQLSGAQKCVDQHCPKFPQVTMINNDDKEAAMSEKQSIVDAGCDKMCTEEGIEATCAKEFTLNVDFVMFEIEETCQGEAKPAMDTCMGDKQGDIDADFEDCKTKDGETCDSQAEECMADQADDTAAKEEAQKFCDERKTMCQEQVSKHCSEANEKALKVATKECKVAYDEEMKTCIADATEKKREEDVKACVDKTTPTCKDDCQDGCQLEDLDKCQEDLMDAGRGVTQSFCEDVWQWLYDSEQVDPKTGDVIPKALAVKKKSDAPDLLADAE
jgi:hypothetical protein